MIYRLLVLSDEVDLFFREIEVNSDCTFLDLQNAVFDSVGYAKNQLTTFFLCESTWEKKQEITLMEMEVGSEYDTYLMGETRLDDFDLDKGDRMMLTYDMLADRSFFIEIKEVKGGSVAEAVCILSEGNAPQQLMGEDEFLKMAANVPVVDGMDDFYGDSQYDIDELDVDGFGGMESIDDLGEGYY